MGPGAIPPTFEARLTVGAEGDWTQRDRRRRLRTSDILLRRLNVIERRTRPPMGSPASRPTTTTDRLYGELDWHTPAERYDGTPFTARGFEGVPALDHLQGWLGGVDAGMTQACLTNPGNYS